MNYRKNVVEKLWVIHTEIGGRRHNVKVCAESETQAREKAERELRSRFDGDRDYRILSVESIGPEDYI